MTQIPADWYPDPWSASGRSQHRFWDGERWTEHTLPQGAAPSHSVKSTPDGQRLAGWWARVGATLLDGLIALPLFLLASLPVVIINWEQIGEYYSA